MSDYDEDIELEQIGKITIESKSKAKKEEHEVYKEKEDSSRTSTLRYKKVIRNRKASSKDKKSKKYTGRRLKQEKRKKEPKKAFPKEKKAKKKVKKDRTIYKATTPDGISRLTAPKKRNIISRVMLQSKLAKDGFYDLENEFDSGEITAQDVEESKNAKRWIDRSLYRKVQKYEDAIDDVRVRTGWKAFKIGLAAAMLAGSLALTAATTNEMKNMLNDISSANVVATYQQLDEEQKNNVDIKADIFRLEVEQKTGYAFDYISEDAFSEGYYSIINYEKKMLEGVFKKASFDFKDQELLNRIVKESIGESYATLTESQIRDYKQLAFELLPVALPEIFNDDSFNYLRSPIVYDHLLARDSAKEKGYKIELVVNNGEEETLKNIGTLIHNINLIDMSTYESASTQNKGQDFLNQLIIDSVGEEQYETYNKRTKRDYLQVAYEFLPEEVKDRNLIEDPIIIEREAFENERGIGD